MHNDDTQDRYNLVYLVHNPRRDLDPYLVQNTRLDRMSSLLRMYSLDRNRRT